MMIKNEVTRTEADYLPQVIVDYQGNPFIEALPPILSSPQAVDALTVEPGYHKSECELDEHYRLHCIQRLFRYFQPLDTHIDIEQRISRSIRQGYVNRNPVRPEYVRRLRQCGEAIQERSFDAVDFRSVKSTAAGFTMIGMSGVGKTTAIDRVLSLYPQCITHTSYEGQPFYVKQLVWMKLDCPYDGSIKALCLNFFSEADRILESDYSKKFYAARNTVDTMLPRMAQIASTHGVGLLVIDEIQHLSQAKSGGSEKMLNFFVTLVNTIGIPVVLIGTSKAMPILQSEFRQARRGSGQGDLFWERMTNDESWDIMLQTMWKYNWTKKPCSLTKVLKDALYDESQGIIDIAVKLYALAQIKAIADGTEQITPQHIHEVASERLRLVKPMLDALRSGNMKKIMQYEDIRPISVEDFLSSQSLKISRYEGSNKPVTSLEEQVVLKLLEMDIPAKNARQCVKKVMAGKTAAQPFGQVLQKAFKLALNAMPQGDTAEQDSLPDQKDIRKMAGESAYEKLKTAGMVAEDTDEW